MAVVKEYWFKKFPRFSEKTAFSTCQSPYLSIRQLADQQVKNANV